jgi:hypothetical protein
VQLLQIKRVDRPQRHELSKITDIAYRRPRSATTLMRFLVPVRIIPRRASVAYKEFDERKNSRLFTRRCSHSLNPPRGSAQHPKKVNRIGYLVTGDAASESTRSEAIRLALRELGYIEGQNIATQYRYAEVRAIGSLSLLPSCCVSRLILSWYQEGISGFGRLRMRPRRFPS